MSAKEIMQQEFFFNRLQKNYRQLKKWAKKKDVGSFRVYDRDIPEIPLALDVYSVQCVDGIESETDEIQYAILYLYERPYRKDPDEESLWLERMKDAAARALDISRERIIASVRKRQRGKNQYVKNENEGIRCVMREHGARFHITLGSYIDTGIFCCHRIMRGMMRETAAAKRVLNLFCYTGSFSVAAALGGASSVDSVDLSNTYLAAARRNFALNGLPASLAYNFIRSDVKEFLTRAARQNRLWDIIILDPPTFSNSKKTHEPLDINNDWSILVNLCLDALDADGELFFSTNSRRFKFDTKEIAQKTKHGYAVRFEDITSQITSKDFSRRVGQKAWKFFVL